MHNRFGALWVYLRVQGVNGGLGVGDVERLHIGDLAEAVGATRQTIGLIEAGRYNPSLKLCVAICKTLGVTLNDLFWDDDAS